MMFFVFKSIKRSPLLARACSSCLINEDFNNTFDIFTYSFNLKKIN